MDERVTPVELAPGVVATPVTPELTQEEEDAMRNVAEREAQRVELYQRRKEILIAEIGRSLRRGEMVPITEEIKEYGLEAYVNAKGWEMHFAHKLLKSVMDDDDL